MSSLNEADAESLVPAHSPDGAAAADSDGHSPLRRMFLASVLGTLLRREVGTLAVTFCRVTVIEL